jgi:hypothetical protein
MCSLPVTISKRRTFFINLLYDSLFQIRLWSFSETFVDEASLHSGKVLLTSLVCDSKLVKFTHLFFDSRLAEFEKIFENLFLPELYSEFGYDFRIIIIEVALAPALFWTTRPIWTRWATVHWKWPRIPRTS